MATAALTRRRTFLDPTLLYSYRGFIEASGISTTRLHLAKRAGIEPNWLVVGKRKFLKGADAIEFIEKLAALGQRAATPEIEA